MPAAPAPKRQKIDEPAATRPNTRSSASTPLAPPPPPLPAPAPGPTADNDNDEDAMDQHDDDEEPFEYESDIDSEPDCMALDSPHEEAEGQLADSSDNDQEEGPPETLVLSDSDDAPPPEPRGRAGAAGAAKGKGKLTARKQFALDVDQVRDRFASDGSSVVKSGLHPPCGTRSLGADLALPRADFKRDEGDDAVRFALEHPNFPRDLRISLLFPELGGYPQNHEVVAFTEHEEVPDEVSAALHEVSQCVTPSHTICTLLS